MANNGTVRNEMTLALVRRSDVNTILSCEASNNIETTPVSSFVLVDLLCKLTVSLLEQVFGSQDTFNLKYLIVDQLRSVTLFRLQRPLLQFIQIEVT